MFKQQAKCLAPWSLRSGGGDRFRKNKQKMSLNEMGDGNTTNMIGAGGSRLYVGRWGDDTGQRPRMRSGQQSKDLERAVGGMQSPRESGAAPESGVPPLPSSGAPGRGAEFSLLIQSPLLAPPLTGQVLLTKPGDHSIPTGNTNPHFMQHQPPFPWPCYILDHFCPLSLYFHPLDERPGSSDPV